MIEYTRVLQRLRESGLKLSPKKCTFLQEKVKYIGHIVSKDGIEPDPAKIEKVTTWPRPTTPDEVRQFHGFIGYYRKFAKDFSKIAKPLIDLMPVPKKKTRCRAKSPSTTSWIWGQLQENAFQQLKRQLQKPPILGFPQYNKPFELHTDASMLGFGAVLYQEQDNQKRVIAYASRGLSKSKKNYPVHKLEFLALKWAVTEKYHDYLYGNTFTVLTDNNPLTYVLTSAKLDATGHRWIAALASYNFSIMYRPGSSNADADGLSRLPGLLGKNNVFNISTESVKAICNIQHVQPYVQCLLLSVTSADEPPLPNRHLIDVNDLMRLSEYKYKLEFALRLIQSRPPPLKIKQNKKTSVWVRHGVSKNMKHKGDTGTNAN